MTLRRRLMMWLLLAAPAVWAGALAMSFFSARHEINELFDTELVRLTRQLLATLPAEGQDVPFEARTRPDPLGPDTQEGDAEPKDLLVAVWDRDGRQVLVDTEGLLMPYLPGRRGFTDITLGDRPWRAYYLPSPSGRWLVATGQRMKERRDVALALTLGPLLPWLATLPVLLGVMAVGLRRVMRPMDALSRELSHRAADDLHPLQVADLPADLRPLVDATNAQFARTERLLKRERRFTADAAHELRTPLAALQAQWDAALLGPAAQSGAQAGAQAAQALDKIGQGLARLSRLVTQLLLLSRVDTLEATDTTVRIDWQGLIGDTFNSLLPLAERLHVELACEWPTDVPHDAATSPLPWALRGDPDLMATLLRNLLDNALRHSPPGGQVVLRIGADSLSVLDDGPGVTAEHLPRLGDRFFRPPGQTQPGSGLGLSIVKRIAALHALDVSWGPREDAPGFCVRVFAAGASQTGAVSPRPAHKQPVDSKAGQPDSAMPAPDRSALAARASSPRESPAAGTLPTIEM